LSGTAIVAARPGRASLGEGISDFLPLPKPKKTIGIVAVCVEELTSL
jgi:hypothetical protein